MSEQSYLNLLREVYETGVDRPDRTGTGTRGLFGRQIRFDLSQGFPLLTTKKVFMRGIIEELLWFLRGSTNAKELEDIGVNIWSGWGDPETRELGPVYGSQWRKWKKPMRHATYDRHGIAKTHHSIDQISILMESLKNDPMSRRHIVVAWNPAELDQMALPPCHCLFQFNVRPLSVAERQAAADNMEVYTVGHAVEMTDEDWHDYFDRIGVGSQVPRYRLDCQLYQRSGDIFLGVPFNIASYAALTMMIAQQCNMLPGDFVHTFGDLHLYSNHFDQAVEQLSRQPRPFPTLRLNKAQDIFSYRYDDFVLEGYDSHPTIKAPVAI